MSDSIYASQIHIYPTYQGLLIGIPDEEMNVGFINSAKEKAVKLFGEPVYVKEPKIEMYSDEHNTTPIPRLPGWTIISQIESHETADPHYDGRTLTHVMFVDNKIYEKPITQVVEDAAQELTAEWKNISKLWAW